MYLGDRHSVGESVMNDDRLPLQTQLDHAIVQLDQWASLYHHRNEAVSEKFKAAAHTLAEIRIDLFGEPQ